MSKRENKKEAILLAGMQVMKAQGYNGTSVKDIVDAASVPKGSFYNYFDSKEQFALEAIEYAAEDSCSQALTVLSDHERCPLERIKSFFLAGAQCASDQDFTIGCFVGNMCQEMADSSHLIRGQLNHAFSRYVRMIGDAVEQGQRRGSIASDLDSRQVADYLFNAWEGSLMRAKASKSRAPLDAFVAMLDRVLK